jgi:predicted nicotinamide N-methyase
MVLAGDLFYEAEMAARAESLLRRAARLGLKNLAVDVGRTFRPKAGFRVLCSMRVPVYPEIEGVESRDTTIISLEAE